MTDNANRNYDAIIIGAGVIGACTAYEMAKAGMKTLSIDKKGGRGSGLDCGVLRDHPAVLFDGGELCARL